MATFTVTTTRDVVNANDGVLSLREAVAQANGTAGADTINFAAAAEGKTIVLTGGQLTITRDVTIDGDRDNNGSRVTIDGNPANVDFGEGNRVLQISGTGTDVGLADVVITGGRGDDSINGGGIAVGANSTLTLTRTNVVDNDTFGSAGGIFVAEQGRLIARNSRIEENSAESTGGIEARAGSYVRLENSVILGNSGYYIGGQGAGGIRLVGSDAHIIRSTIADNFGAYGGIDVTSQGSLVLVNSTIAGNGAADRIGAGFGGGIRIGAGSSASVTDSTITGNRAGSYYASEAAGGGIANSGTLRLSNSIVAGNTNDPVGNTDPIRLDDISGTITTSNGHNIFSTNVQGNAAGDLENVAPSRLFAAIDPDTRGGQLANNGGPTPTVALRNDLNNPALGGADPDDASATDQRGTTRPQPAGTDPDIGAFELKQTGGGGGPTNGDDVLAGTSGPDSIDALGGNDTVRGGAGNDTLGGGTGNDFLDGQAGNDRVNGAAGNDEVRGGIGSDNVRGGPGTDLLFGNAGRDVFDFDRVSDSAVGAARDRIGDFVRGVDRLDLSTIDANTAVGGNQAFSFIGGGGFTEAGQVRAFASGPDTVIQGSTDGDRAAEFEIVLTGNISLSASDFIL